MNLAVLVIFLLICLGKQEQREGQEEEDRVLLDLNSVVKINMPRLVFHSKKHFMERQKHFNYKYRRWMHQEIGTLNCAPSKLIFQQEQNKVSNCVLQDKVDLAWVVHQLAIFI